MTYLPTTGDDTFREQVRKLTEKSKVKEMTCCYFVPIKTGLQILAILQPVYGVINLFRLSYTVVNSFATVFFLFDVAIMIQAIVQVPSFLQLFVNLKWLNRDNAETRKLLKMSFQIMIFTCVALEVVALVLVTFTSIPVEVYEFWENAIAIGISVYAYIVLLRYRKILDDK